MQYDMKYIKTAFKVIKNKTKFWGLTLLSSIITKKINSVYVFDKGLKKDNVWGLVQELNNNEKYSDFKIYYYTGISDNVDGRIVFMSSKFKALWKSLRSKYILHSYMEIQKMYPVRGQIILNTMHGSPLKRIGFMESTTRLKFLNNYNKAFTYILCQSEYFKEVIKESYGANEEQCLILGYPRNDFMFSERDVLSLIHDKKDIKKSILWMPTWRRDTETKNNNDSNIEFPILDKENVKSLNTYLKETKTLLIIKPHPFQMKLDLFDEIQSNILIVDNELLNSQDIELYNLLNNVDALLTDYSSIYFDYLLLNKPIGFTIDDIDAYMEKRGFIIDNPFEIMPGEKIYNFDELIKFVNYISIGHDKFEEERIRVNELVNFYKDGHSAKRVLERIIGE